MKGYCKPKDKGIYYFNNQVMVAVHNRQKWQYIYGMKNGKNIVVVRRNNVSLYLDKDVFEKDWKIDR